MARHERQNGVATVDDRSLVHAFLARGEEEAFRKLYRRHAPKLYLLALRMVGGSESDAEDVVQVTWMRATENMSAFRWESTLSSWLCGIAINCSREHIRRRTRRDHDSLEDMNGAEPPMRRSEHNRIDLERAITQLPDGYREVLVLHDVEGYTHGEIGRMLGIQTGTSKSQLSRARGAVRRWLVSGAPRAEQVLSDERPA